MLHHFYGLFKLYTPKECDEIFEFAKNNVTEFYSDKHGEKKNVDTFLCETDVIRSKLRLFFQSVTQINEEYFGFKLYDHGPFTLNFNEYLIGKEYPYHLDRSALGSSNDIKLTAILNLSTQPFSGGEFDFFLGKDLNVEFINEPGTLLVFPSFYYHRVRPVTSGVRRTMSGWFYGDNWK